MTGIRAALISGTVLSLAAVTAWSYSANLAVGPPGPLDLTRNWLADYFELAGAATGNGIALYAMVAVIYTLCFLVAGLRARARALREASRETPDFADERLISEGRSRR
jgi:hypothetical protein